MEEAIKLHPGQSQIINDLFVDKTNRYSVVCAARGFGKSYVAAVAAVLAVEELLLLPPKIPNKNISIVASTYQQTIDVYYPLLAFEFGLEAISENSSRREGYFLLPNNVKLKLWSYESVQRMKGSGQYFVVCDEISSWKGQAFDAREAWESVIQPCLTTRWSAARAKALGATSPGRALMISTPIGHDYFYDLYNFQELDDSWRSYRYTYRESPYLDPVEIEKTRNTIDHLKFQREYEASFEESGNNVFYNFDRKNNVTSDLSYFDTGEDIHVAIDFNVGVMASVIFAVRAGQIHILDELQGHPDTETLAANLISKFPSRNIITYPDPSGRARKSSSPTGVTDFTILKGHPFNFATLARSRAPGIIDSVASVNRMLKTADKKNHLFIHPRCVNTIRSFEKTVWKENNPDIAVLDKTMGVEHWTDGIRYAIDYLFPIQGSNAPVRRGFDF